MSKEFLSGITVLLSVLVFGCSSVGTINDPTQRTPRSQEQRSAIHRVEAQTPMPVEEQTASTDSWIARPSDQSGRSGLGGFIQPNIPAARPTVIPQIGLMLGGQDFEILCELNVPDVPANQSLEYVGVSQGTAELVEDSELVEGSEDDLPSLKSVTFTDPGYALYAQGMLEIVKGAATDESDASDIEAMVATLEECIEMVP